MLNGFYQVCVALSTACLSTCLAPPQLYGDVLELTGKQGSSITMDFRVSGSPIPSVAWEHEGRGEVAMSLRRRVVELSGGTTSLTIAELVYEDEGVYVCTAINNLGTVSASCRLMVLGKGHYIFILCRRHNKRVPLQ